MRRLELDESRRLLLSLYSTALERVSGRGVVRRFLLAEPPPSSCALIAVGKAAIAMTEGALDALGERVERGLVVTKHGHADGFSHPAIDVLTAGHPQPDAASLEAGQHLLAFVDTLPAGLPLLFLLSGGASALVEVLPEGVGLDELTRLNLWLVGSGLAIGEMNHVRKRFSCIKGGRLALRLGARPVFNLLLSDVPGDDPATIGSGPLIHSIEPQSLPSELPEWVLNLLRSSSAPPVVDADFPPIRSIILATNQDAQEAAEGAAQARGLCVFRQPDLLSGDAIQQGRELARQVLNGAPGLYVWGGETTVVLPPQPGQGGRCQALALAAAREISGRDDILFMAISTDGTDGPGEDAGALVDGATLQRGAADGLDAAACLAAADSGSFLLASGDLIHTGPTGSNVMDLVLALKSHGIPPFTGS